ncbi:methionyl aminopeptidase [Clavulina sp. PMI_390]|nr:methionyl aminopeptidase [Clavulina sp. PMI_390]
MERIQRFGDYSPVLSESPHAVGVDHIPMAEVPAPIPRPPYIISKAGYPPVPAEYSIIKLGTSEETGIRNAATLARNTLKFAGGLVQVGVTTEEIDDRIRSFTIENGAYPSPLGYLGYPKSCCTSVNNVIVHGIPDGRPLEDGDIVNVDVSVYLNGYHGDCSETFLVGNVDEKGRALVEASHLALEAGIAACGPGKPLKGIGNAISDLLNPMGYSVFGNALGHGIGRHFHLAPFIVHHHNNEPGIMHPGYCMTIEPAIIQGNDPRGWMLPDNWTLLTETFARAAQKEHTILITETGVDVLTR